MIHKKTLILEDTSLLPDSEVVLNIGKKESYVFEIPMNDEILKRIKPDYVADSTYVIFHLAEMSKQIQLKCKLYSNVLIIKGAIAIDTAGDLIANLYLRNPNKKVIKLGDLKVKVMEEQDLEVYEFEEDIVAEEPVKNANSNQAVNTIDQRLLIEAILDVKSNVKNIAQTYFEEEFNSQIGAKWYDGVGKPNNSIGIEGDYYLNISDGDIFKFTLSQWERIGNIKGDTGEQGPIGLTGPQGPEGPQGIAGQDGKQGPEGRQGPQGEQGPIGLQGPQGEKGDKGEQGNQGEPGSKWYDGVGLPTKDKGRNGDYYLNLSTEGNGDVYSKYGDIWHRVGSLGRGKRSVIMGDDEYWATVEFVTESIESINTALTAKVDKVEGYRLSQEDFTSELKAKLEKLEAIPGPQGEKGEKGDRGEKGETGSQGPRGEVGPKGDKGEQGLTGEQGPKGVAGKDGKSLEFNWNNTQLGIRQQGESDYTYVDLKGLKGDQGIQGVKGEAGAQGLRGEVGPKGDRGEQGLPGEKGDKGDKGVHVGPLNTAPESADVIFDNSDIDIITEGVTPNIQVGEVVTINPDEQATVIRKGTNKAPIFDFKIPRGRDAITTLTRLTIDNNILNLTKDKWQKVDMANNTTINLPQVTDFTEIHLFFRANSTLTLILPNSVV